jgi:hypothetical protein
MSDKIEQFWRDATADDVARVMKGEKVEARFRDEDTDIWSVSRFLGGYDATRPNSLHWISNNANQWKQCQVYEPQQWWLDKPDPGEGFRLLKKFPDEPKLATDEGWFPDHAKWCPIENDNGIQLEGYWYRRRIEPNPPEKLDSCVDHLEVGKEYKLPSGQSIFVTEKGFEVF